MAGKARDPGTREEWQRAADAASALLVLAELHLAEESAQDIDRAACEDILRRARERGIEARASALGRYAAERTALGASPDPERDLAGLPPQRERSASRRR